MKPVERAAAAILTDARILSGDEIGPSDATWQDVAGTLATNLEVVAGWLHKARRGQVPDAGMVARVAALLTEAEQAD